MFFYEKKKLMKGELIDQYNSPELLSKEDLIHGVTWPTDFCFGWNEAVTVFEAISWASQDDDVEVDEGIWAEPFIH